MEALRTCLLAILNTGKCASVPSESRTSIEASSLKKF